MKTTVSPSEFDSFVSCSRKHYYQYGLNVQGRTTSESLKRGTLGHKFLADYFQDRLNGTSVSDAIKTSLVAMAMYFMENPDDVSWGTAAQKAITVFYERGGMAEYTILAVEKEFTAEVYGTEMLFVVDLIVKDEHGSTGIVDHKFISTLYNPYNFGLMSQLPKYMAALLSLGYDIEWAAYNEFKHSGKQDNEFAIVDITPARLERTMQEHAMVARKILAIKQYVEDNPDDGLAEWSDTAVRTQNSMICKNCSMAKLCESELNDQNPQVILDQHFMRKTYDNARGTVEDVPEV